ncbi:class I SAM-dependent methyltransferase [Nocardiopsis metallicus]|uniref:SAM-dependent methyltransferase n=1 Tax=Nocardiopsis metallicus TaxID=179819 RepID=A0A840W007_9ACTN|nr:class I SAM-dependent methyltransferase [Nocardiopsis metallicus]MBB5489392.1 SAM-dependent methyltransferase [Nocardiopsis metallicus]
MARVTAPANGPPQAGTSSTRGTVMTVHSTETTLDQARAEEFANRMVEVLDTASTSLLLSLGHRLGIFDTMAGSGAMTCAQVAEAAQLNERYTREWLAGATMARLIDYDPRADTYLLPPEHAACLTRAAGPDNLARFMAVVPLLASVDEKVEHAFRHGGGVPYSAYTRFHEVMAEMSGEVMDASLINTLLPMMDGLPERLAMGIDVADIGCGRGHAVNVMGRTYPDSTFVGYDFNDEALAFARGEADAMRLSNVRFELRDVADLGVTEEFDLVTAFDSIHDQAHPAQVLAAIHQALRPSGGFLMVDVRASSHLHENMDMPLGTFLYTVSLMHCMTVSLALEGDGLGTAWGEQKARELLAEAGFGDVQVMEIDTDPLDSCYVAKKT